MIRMNKAIYGGALTANPELTYANGVNGQFAIAKFTIATEGMNKDNTQYIRCEITGKKAEVINKYMGKGSEILVEGKMINKQYTKDNMKRDWWVCQVSEFYFAGKKDNNGSSANEYGAANVGVIPGGFAPVAEVPFSDFC